MSLSKETIGGEIVDRDRDHEPAVVRRCSAAARYPADRTGGGRAAGVREQAPAAAAEVDAESFEHRGRTEIGRHNLADRCRGQSLAHHCPRFLDPE